MNYLLKMYIKLNYNANILRNPVKHTHHLISDFYFCQLKMCKVIYHQCHHLYFLHHEFSYIYWLLCFLFHNVLLVCVFLFNFLLIVCNLWHMSKYVNTSWHSILNSGNLSYGDKFWKYDWRYSLKLYLEQQNLLNKLNIW